MHNDNKLAHQFLSLSEYGKVCLHVTELFVILMMGNIRVLEIYVYYFSIAVTDFEAYALLESF